MATIHLTAKSARKWTGTQKKAIVGLAAAGTLVIGSTIATNIIMNKAAKKYLVNGRSFTTECFGKKTSDIRKSAQKGLAHVNRALFQRQTAMNNTSKAFDALNSVARKFR